MEEIKNSDVKTTLSEKDILNLYNYQKVYDAVVKGQRLREQKEFEKKKQDDCNHRKGGFCEYIHGKGYTGRVGLGSAANDYCVIKHTFPWGDQWVRCTRCGKWWKPGDENYKEALLFPTSNQSSTSMTFELSKESIERAREATRGT